MQLALALQLETGTVTGANIFTASNNNNNDAQVEARHAGKSAERAPDNAAHDIMPTEMTTTNITTTRATIAQRVPVRRPTTAVVNQKRGYQAPPLHP